MEKASRRERRGDLELGNLEHPQLEMAITFKFKENSIQSKANLSYLNLRKRNSSWTPIKIIQI